MGNYVLDVEGHPVFEPDIRRWANWFEDGNDKRRVAADKVRDWTISTVFLAIDHSFHGGPPVLWETMVFGPEPWDDWQDRYTSQEAAVAGHKRVVEAIRRGDDPPD